MVKGITAKIFLSNGTVYTVEVGTMDYLGTGINQKRALFLTDITGKEVIVNAAFIVNVEILND